MAKFVLNNVRLYAGGTDLSGDTNTATLTANKADVDVTNYNSNLWKERLGGLGTAEIKAQGYWEAGTTTAPLVDDTSWANLGLAGGITIAPAGALDAAPCYFTNMLETDYQPIMGKVGDVAGYSLDVMSTWPLVKGIFAAPAGTALTSTGTGTITQLGAVAAGQNIYADFHVFSVAGTSTPTITMVIQSAALVGFGSPTARISFTAATAVGGQILRTPGAITDTFWRASWTITGSSPSFLAAVSFGIA
jgi:hypothetical protein